MNLISLLTKMKHHVRTAMKNFSQEFDNDYILLQCFLISSRLRTRSCMHKPSLRMYCILRTFKFVLSQCICSFLTGLMADELGSYITPFYTAGAIQIAGASVTSLLTCVERGLPEEAETQASIDEELLVTEKLTVV